MPARATHHIIDVGGKGATRRAHIDVNAKDKYPRPVSEEAVHSSETNKVVLVNKRHIICAVFANELLDLVRVIVVAIGREVVIIIASEVSDVLGRSTLPFAQHACSFDVTTLATLNMAGAIVTEVRALKDVSIRASSPIGAISTEPKCSTHRIAPGVLSVNKGAVWLVAFALGEMQTQWSSLFSQLVIQVTVVAI